MSPIGNRPAGALSITCWTTVCLIYPIFFSRPRRVASSVPFCEAPSFLMIRTTPFYTSSGGTWRLYIFGRNLAEAVAFSVQISISCLTFTRSESDRRSGKDVPEVGLRSMAAVLRVGDFNAELVLDTFIEADPGEEGVQVLRNKWLFPDLMQNTQQSRAGSPSDLRPNLATETKIPSTG